MREGGRRPQGVATSSSAAGEQGAARKDQAQINVEPDIRRLLIKQNSSSQAAASLVSLEGCCQRRGEKRLWPGAGHGSGCHAAPAWGASARRASLGTFLPVQWTGKSRVYLARKQLKFPICITSCFALVQLGTQVDREGAGE